jgi:hypothetical protein
MENILKKIILLCSLFLLSCENDIIERNEIFPALDPINVDLDGGTWLPILLNAPDEFSLPEPIATNTPTYTREINEIKSYQANLSAEQARIIKYWSVGGVLRWNEIMQGLVAKYNRPPYQNPDGTYPAPSAANPFNNPQFPFANPPYAARAYAYVSAAQYDAMIATWHYKTLYNREAPFVVDPTLKVLVPKSSLPSYPSEDGVLCGVTVEILKLLFPTEIAFIQQKADEHKLSRIISGANVRSDVEEGIILGRKIASKFINKAATDNAGAAIGTPEIWNQLELNMIANGEIPWRSLDLPSRPPMLPLFGNVKSMLMTPQDFIDNKPPPPPSTNSPLFLAELEEVKSYMNNNNMEYKRIVTYWADGVGTYTPPGHWNAIAIRYFVPERFSEIRWARNMALLNIAFMDAAIGCWAAKYEYFNPRPSQVDPSIKTSTGIPNFPAYVSGHSTFSGAAAAYLSYVLPSKTVEFNAMAQEASMSRLYGCIHYRSDCEAGLLLGKKIAKFAVRRAQIDGAD